MFENLEISGNPNLNKLDGSEFVRELAALAVSFFKAQVFWVELNWIASQFNNFKVSKKNIKNSKFQIFQILYFKCSNNFKKEKTNISKLTNIQKYI